MQYPLTRRSFLGAALAATMAACKFARSEIGTVAFSLRQAEHLLRAGQKSVELSSLAGISRFLGLVHDKKSDDIVLVGRRLKGSPPLNLDELAAAIQARVVQQEWPLVSIDRVADTEKTGTQRIRWEGGVESSALGAKLLAADVILKKAALGLPPATGFSFESYFDLCSARATSGQLTPSGNRFWFHAADAALLSRENVFILQDLNVGVKSLPVASTAVKDELADRYAATFSANYDAIGHRHAEIAALQPLFDAVAVAHGIESLPPHLHDFWAHRYQPARVETPSEYPLIRRRERLKAKDKEVVLELNGGVDSRIFVQRLRDGDHVAFQEAVLKTRPRRDALTWPLPLNAWLGKAEATPNEEKLLNTVSGTTIHSYLSEANGIGPSSFPLPSANRGGIYADVPVTEADIRPKK